MVQLHCYDIRDQTIQTKYYGSLSLTDTLEIIKEVQSCFMLGESDVY